MSRELTERQAFLVLNGLPHIGSIVLNRLLAEFGGDPRAVLAAGRQRLGAVEGVRPSVGAIVADWRGHFDLEREENRLAQAGADFITVGDDAYPQLLREIQDPPAGLYRLGSYGLERTSVAIVGTRRPTLYGEAVARKLGADLVQCGFCVVSGLARGIDAAAHEGALAAGGKTVAVLGTGLDFIYPPENKALYRRIEASGALLSEFPFGCRPDRQSFPQRNRIVSGLCAAIVVVESGGEGGSMITARFAGEQGRTVFAVPGRLDQPTSAGCHQLIRDGATLLTSVEDIFSDLTYLEGLRPASASSKTGAKSCRKPATNLSADEQLVFACFRGGAILAVNALTERTGLPAARLSAALMMLEIKHLIAKRMDASYEETNAQSISRSRL